MMTQWWRRSGAPMGEVMWAMRAELLAVAAFSLVVNLMMLTPTLYMLQVYDRVMLSRSELTLLAVSLLALFLYGIMALADGFRARLLVRSGLRFDQALGARVFEASVQRRLESGDTGSRGDADLMMVRQFITGNGVYAFFDAPWTPIYILVLAMLHPWLGVTALVFGVIQASLAWWGHREASRVQQASAQASSQADYFLQAKLRNMDVIWPMGMLKPLYQRWEQRHQAALCASTQAQFQTGRTEAISKFVRYVQQSASLAVGAWLVIRGEISPGAMIAGNVLMGKALAPIDSLVSLWPSWLACRAAWGRLRELLNVPSSRGRWSVPMVHGELQILHLTLTAPNRPDPILSAVSFHALPGSITVVLGASGSGKSSLARALLGIWPPSAGRVLLDGQSIERWDPEALGPWVGYLPQEVELFEGSVAQNIARLGEVDGSLVVKAAISAGLHDMILRLPQGYETPIGPGGGFLSGGQRQRIGLARALYGEPKVLVLDEPNAFLDEEGEKALHAAVIAARQRGCTVLLITHRPALLDVADRLLMLEAGRVRAEGPKEHVLTQLQAPAQAPRAPAKQFA
ncbi:MAG: type I secretion system permease/ATPase [Burkholderiales bacterium]